LRLADYLSADPADPDSLYAGEAALLTGWELDRVRFRVAGSTYRVTDLAHWLALEVAADALADAGFPEAAGLPRDATGVLVGNSLTGETSRAQLVRLRWPYVRRTVAAALLREGWDGDRLAAFLADLEAQYKSPFPEPNEESLAGGLSNTIAGRICNQLDLHGGGYTVDGACASSLLAVANACSSLVAGDLDVALAGGVDISLDPFELVGFARTGALTPGEMRVYDARSQGFVPGEGSGFVVLMREGDAVRRGCRIHAVVRGWGISSDGHGGISRPEAAGQRLALARAYRRAGFGPETVGYFEGHGTGTAVGDAAELEALSTTLAEARQDDLPPVPVGSVKANIGHTKAAAGVAGLIKATLALGAQVLPPNTGCTEPHPILRQPGSPLRVLERGEAWPEDRPLRAAVSAMGFGGINSHVVLAGGDEAARPRRRALSPRERVLLASAQDAELFLLAAPDAASLAAKAERLAGLAPRLSRSELTDLAAELARRLEPGPVRAALVASTPGELTARLDRLRASLAAGEEALVEPGKGLFLSVGARPRRIGLLFPGQGSPSYLGRGGALARRIEGLDEIYGLATLPLEGDPQNTGVAQPAIVAHSLAGLEALERLGLRATVAVGHSLGEIPALCWASGLTREEALELARARGRAMASLNGGAMASVAATPEIMGQLLSEIGPGAVIAAYNGPARTVVSGDPSAIEAVLARAASRGLATTRLRVSHAFHSPLVAAAEPELAAALEPVPPRRLTRAVVSTVTGALLEAAADLRGILRRQVTAPVRFTEALAAARGQADLWIEVGPGHALTDLAAEILGPSVPILPLDAGSPSLAGLLEAAGALFALGGPVDLESLFAGRFSRPFDPDLPLRFLENPCEQAPVLESDRSVRSDRPVRSVPAPVPAAGEAVDATPLEVVRHLIAERAELPLAAVRDDSRLLSDLHLSSISVGQLVTEAARRLGLRPTASPTDYAQATLAEIAQALEEQMRLAPASGAEEEAETVPAGVDAWVRPFTVAWIERALPRRTAAPAEPGDWQIVAPDGHPLREALAAELPGSGVALCLPPEPDETHAGLFFAAAQAVLSSSAERFVVVQHGGGGGGFARTLHLEMPAVTTCVVDLPFDLPDAASRVAAEARAAQGYAEARYDREGVRRVPVLRLLSPAPAAPLPLGPEDVLLVTGGGKGIGAECALDLAKATGARLLLLGRSAPESDAELAANLERMRAAGVTVLYASADVTDAEAVRDAVGRAEPALGPVTSVLHAAGTNEPRLLVSLDEAAFRRTLAPKVKGLENVLAAVDPARLRLLIAFGSIIGRAGLKGEADYATANEWLGLRVERLSRENPGCRGLTLEWSVWAGVGMGERLGTLERLSRQGISPIPPDAGVAALRALLSRDLPDTSVVVAGRFGAPPTVEMERSELPLLRYLEKPRVFVPGVELVVDTQVSADTDPHLADHVLRGEPLFAAVFGLEAMVQAAQAVSGRGQSELPQLENVELRRPVVVPPGRSTTLRIAALVREPGLVEVAVRDASTGFQADHFRAVCRFSETGSLSPRLGFPISAKIALDPAELYGGILFHAGRFRRLHEYRHLRATECLAGISPDGATAWFGRWLPGELVLGDPGARDAAIHGIQACIPHRTLLPTGVDRIVTGRLGSSETLSFAAREISRNGDDFVYDLEILAADGSLRERWEGLRLRAVDRTPAPPVWSSALLAPWAERRLQELFPTAGVRVVLERAEHREAVRHRPDGRPEAKTGGEVSVSHAGGLVLSVTRDGRIGCDLEPVSGRSPEVWRDLLGNERFRLAGLIVHERGEAADGAATRVWAALESLRKAGAPHDAPLTLESATDDGWLLLRSGTLRIATLLASVRELSGSAALAVLVES
jgi:enediyne polyketide synthase